MRSLNNENFTDASTIVDRRQENINSDILWDKLTDPQQLTVCSLFPTGYVLTCARKVENRLLAIMVYKQDAITIDYLGNIHVAEGINLRE